MNKTQHLLVAGGGIGGMAAALAVSRAGWSVDVHDQVEAFGEVGAGVQLGPNITRIFHAHWGLERAFSDVAFFPERLQLRSLSDGSELGSLPLKHTFFRRYGAPYACIHRADLHALLSTAVMARDNVAVHLSSKVTQFHDSSHSVQIETAQGERLEADVLVAADGVWSQLRRQLLGDGVPQCTGHLAYRAMLKQSALPQSLRLNRVVNWMGPRAHVVQYPVHAGEWMNVVAIIEGSALKEQSGWDYEANGNKLMARLGRAYPPLRELLMAVPEASANAYAWRLWPLCGRKPVSSASEMARGRVALLGDASHPMKPYLAQGAGMAIEDAAKLARVLQMDGEAVTARLMHYAQARWQRVSRVQATSARNGRIYHASGLMRVGRDVAMRLLGECLLDQPWLYGYG